MGDVLLTTALSRQIRKTFPDAALHFAVAEQLAEIYGHNPNVDAVFKYDKKMKNRDISSSFASFMDSHSIDKYNLAVDLQVNLRSGLLLKGVYDRILRMRKRRLHKLSLVYFKRPLDKRNIQIPDLYFETVEPAGVKDDNRGLEFWLPEERDSESYPPEERKRQNTLQGRIAMAPGAHHATKRWPPERFAELADMFSKHFGAEVILLGGLADKSICEYVQNLSNSDLKDRSGAKTISETARLLDSCGILVTNDTGVMHIAAARRVPLVAIFGSTVRWFGFSPYRVTSVVVEKDIPCRPCTHIGRKDCPKGHFDCMKQISVKDVLNAAEKLLEKGVFK